MVIILGNHTCAPVRLPESFNVGKHIVDGNNADFISFTESADSAQNYNRRSSYYGGTFISV
jgi:hypothetical protein